MSAGGNEGLEFVCCFDFYFGYLDKYEMSPASSCEITGLAMSYFYTVEERRMKEIMARIRGFSLNLWFGACRVLISSK